MIRHIRPINSCNLKLWVWFNITELTQTFPFSAKRRSASHPGGHTLAQDTVYGLTTCDSFATIPPSIYFHPKSERERISPSTVGIIKTRRIFGLLPGIKKRWFGIRRFFVRVCGAACAAERISSGEMTEIWIITSGTRRECRKKAATFFTSAVMMTGIRRTSPRAGVIWFLAKQQKTRIPLGVTQGSGFLLPLAGVVISSEMESSHDSSLLRLVKVVTKSAAPPCFAASAV